jgi:hypothetical protein
MSTEQRGTGGGHDMTGTTFHHDREQVALLIALEDLKPADTLTAVRELHKPMPTSSNGPTCHRCQPIDGWFWPCETAKLVYTGAEIAAATQVPR